MKLLLCKNIANLGIVGDVVEVSTGYARNYLIPRHLATEPTQANVKRLAEARRQAEEEIKLQRRQLESLSERMEGVEVTITANASTEGKLYGSITPRDIADALTQAGHKVEKSEVVLGEGPLRRTGEYEIVVHLHADIEATVKVIVVGEAA